MKKALIALPFVATASWAGTTLYSGTQTRAAYDDLVAQLDLASTFVVSNESYSSGFARSQAVTKVATGTGPDAEVVLRIRHDIDHSPIGFGEDGARVSAARIVSTLMTNDAEGDYADFLAAFESATPFMMISNAGFNGTIESTLTMSPLSWTAEEVTIQSSGAEYAFTQDVDGKLTGTGGLKAFTITSPTTIVSLSPSDDVIEIDYVSKAVYTGTQTMSFDHMTVEALDTGIKIAMEDIDFSVDTTAKDNLFDSAVLMKVGNLNSDMPVPLTSFDFGAAVRNVDLSDMDSIAAAQNEYLASGLSAGPDPLESLELVADIYRKMIVPGAALEYSLTLRNDGGEASGKTVLTFDGDGTETGYDTIETVGDLVHALKLSAEFDADQGAVALTPAVMFLANDAMAPWIQSTDSGYSSRIIVDDAVMDANGMIFPVTAMAGDFMTLPLDLSLLMQLDAQ